MLFVYFGLGISLMTRVLSLVPPLNDMSLVFGIALTCFGAIRAFRFYQQWKYRDF